MKVLIFSKSPLVILRLLTLRGKKGLELEVLPLLKLRRSLPAPVEDTLVYLDVRGLNDRERAKVLSVITENPRVSFGVLDPAGAVKDIAALFHAGAVDYIGKKLTSAALTAKRVSAVSAYARSALEAPEAVESMGADLPEPGLGAVSDGWADIAPGKEHRFAFLLIEADNVDELKKRHEPQNLANAMETFRGFIERIVLQHGGRLWMWSRFGGLALFPLRDGACSAPLCGLRILLSRVFYDSEESLLPGRLLFRMALSVGATVYQEGDTGKIVSDGVNSIFHLGRRYARPGQFLLTADACELAPPPLRGYLLPAGSFEGRRVMRMLRPIPIRAAQAGDPPWEG